MLFICQAHRRYLRFQCNQLMQQFSPHHTHTHLHIYSIILIWAGPTCKLNTKILDGLNADRPNRLKYVNLLGPRILALNLASPQLGLWVAIFEGQNLAQKLALIFISSVQVLSLRRLGNVYNIYCSSASRLKLGIFQCLLNICI